MGAILSRVSAFGSDTGADTGGDGKAVLAVAYSGGLDSSVLLDLTHAWAAQRGYALHAFHVHHGLSPNADVWEAHCRERCAALGVPFAARRVTVAQDAGTGIEESARVARYAALGEMCRAAGVDVLLTAHHQDDQAETMLLHLLRGSGVAGLAGMDAATLAPGLLGDAHVRLARPLLDASRAQLEAWAAARGLAHVEDESNADPGYTRNALRLHVLPLLAVHFPGYAARLARSAAHLRAARNLLDAAGADDLFDCSDGDSLDLARAARLPQDRLDNLLRHWFAAHGLRAPSTARLAEVRSQLFDAADDAQVCVIHDNVEIRRHRQRAWLLPQRALASAVPAGFRWQGEQAIDFPAFGGTLCFLPAAPGEPGLAVDWLAGQRLTLRHRQGGEKLKLASNRPTRTLKQHCQEMNIPPWGREAMVFVEANGQLLYASGLGMDCRREERGGQGDAPHVVLEWRPHEAS